MDMTQTRFLLLLFASLETLAVQIYNCTNNKVEIFEDAPVPVTCGGIAGDVTWRRGDVGLIGECRTDGDSCTNNLYNDYSLSRSPQSTESRLTLLPEYRRHAGVSVSCTDSVSTASCTLVIRLFHVSKAVGEMEAERRRQIGGAEKRTPSSRDTGLYK